MWDLALRDKSLVDSRSNALLSSLRADLSAWQFIQKSIAALESTFSKGDSVLGEQCGSVAKITKETSPTASGIPCFLKKLRFATPLLPQCLAMTAKAPLTQTQTLLAMTATIALVKKWILGVFTTTPKLNKPQTHKRRRRQDF